MFRITLAACLLLFISTAACVQDFGGDSTQERVTLDQRSTTVIPGLGLDGRLRLSVGDIDRVLEAPDRLGDGPDLRAHIENLVVFDGANILASNDDARVGTLLTFTYDNREFELRVESTDSHTLSPDTVTVLITDRSRHP